VANCPQEHHYMTRHRPYHSRQSDRSNSPLVEVTGGSCHRRPTTKLVSCCICRHTRTCHRWRDNAGVEDQLGRWMAEDAGEGVVDRAAVV